MLHLAKLAVGVRDIADMRAWQARRMIEAPPLRHLTRQLPRRAAEVTQGGSLYWVVQGIMLVRQRILDITRDRKADGTACAALVLDPLLVEVDGGPIRAFQGWRYLEPEDAPPDLAAMPAGEGEASLPEAMRRELKVLRLI